MKQRRLARLAKKTALTIATIGLLTTGGVLSAASAGAAGAVNTEIRLSLYSDGTAVDLSAPNNAPLPAPGSSYGGTSQPNQYPDAIANDQITTEQTWDAGEDSSTTNNVVRTGVGTDGRARSRR